MHVVVPGCSVAMREHLERESVLSPLSAVLGHFGAKRSTDNLATVGNSFTQIKTRRGPRIVSWGTPLFIGFYDGRAPFTLTLCLLSWRKSLIQSTTVKRIPKLSGFNLRPEWETLSKALLRSVKITST